MNDSKLKHLVLDINILPLHQYYTHTHLLSFLRSILGSNLRPCLSSYSIALSRFRVDFRVSVRAMKIGGGGGGGSINGIFIFTSCSSPFSTNLARASRFDCLSICIYVHILQFACKKHLVIIVKQLQN